MAFWDVHGVIPSGGLITYRVRFLMRTAAGVPQTGVAVTVYLSKNAQVGSTLIVNAGVPVGGRTLTEVDAANMPGVYELRLAAIDSDTPGTMVLVCTGGSAEPTYLHVPVGARAGWTGGV